MKLFATQVLSSSVQILNTLKYIQLLWVNFVSRTWLLLGAITVSVPLEKVKLQESNTSSQVDRKGFASCGVGGWVLCTSGPPRVAKQFGALIFHELFQTQSLPQQYTFEFF